MPVTQAQAVPHTVMWLPPALLTLLTILLKSLVPAWVHDTSQRAGQTETPVTANTWEISDVAQTFQAHI